MGDGSELTNRLRRVCADPERDYVGAVFSVYAALPRFQMYTDFMKAADLIDDLAAVVSRLADGERSDDGHTALRDAATIALSKAQTPPQSGKE